MELEQYWKDLPIGKENAVSYEELCCKWQASERAVRRILHELSLYDNGDDFILVRSGKCKGFYITDDLDELNRYKKECLNKGRSVFAPIKKINRIISNNPMQTSLLCNLRQARLAKGLKQEDVVREMRPLFPYFDAPLLSKLENGVVLPTMEMLTKFAEIYGTEQNDIVYTELYSTMIKTAI